MLPPEGELQKIPGGFSSLPACLTDSADISNRQTGPTRSEDRVGPCARSVSVLAWYFGGLVALYPKP